MYNKRHLIVSVTKGKKEDTLLYNNIINYHNYDVLHYDIDDFLFIENNKCGLSKVYNMMLRENSNRVDYIHFIHDDVEILDKWQRECADIESRPDWMIQGVAGASKIEIKYPSLWNTMGDPRSFKGSLHHFTEDGKQLFATPCGLRPAQTVLLDGVYLCVNVDLYKTGKWKFDEQFNFHHYDLAASLDAVNLGYKIGVANINIVHKSHGLHSLNDKEWQESNELFLKKYKK